MKVIEETKLLTPIRNQFLSFAFQVKKKSLFKYDAKQKKEINGSIVCICSY